MPYRYPTPVRKTSVYLPEALKESLHEMSRRSQRSEADLIRTAIERMVRGAQPPGEPIPAPAPLAGPRLVGVGVGPSDPGLVTERARTILRTADRVFAPTTAPDAIGRAEAITRAVAPDAPIERLVYDIAGDDRARTASATAAAHTLADALGTDAVVACVTLGDPNVYSTFSEIARGVAKIRPDVPVSTVPGVMAFQELAAETATVLVEDGQRLVVSLAELEPEQLDTLLDDGSTTVVIYKGGGRVPEIAAQLDAHQRLDGAVLGEMLGLPGGRSVPVSAARQRAASYLATIVVPATT